MEAATCASEHCSSETHIIQHILTPHFLPQLTPLLQSFDPLFLTILVPLKIISNNRNEFVYFLSFSLLTKTLPSTRIVLFFNQ